MLQKNVQLPHGWRQKKLEDIQVFNSLYKLMLIY